MVEGEIKEVKCLLFIKWWLRVVLLSHSLLDEGMFVLQLPLLHGRVDDQLIQLHTTGDEEEHEAAAAVKGAEDKKTQQEVDKLKSQSRHVVKLLDNETKRQHSTV